MSINQNNFSKSICNFNNVSKFLFAPEINTGDTIADYSTFYKGSHIGCDETGSTDFFGPLCIVACYIDERDFDWLKSLNIKDPKYLTDRETIDLARQIKDRIVYSLLMLDNSHYNQLTNDGNNLASLKAKLYNQSITNVMQKMALNINCKVAYQFVSPKTYFNYLKSEIIVVKDLKFLKNEDISYFGIICSRILSKYAFLQYFSNMSKSLKIRLPRGTNNTIDQVAIDLANRYGEKILLKVTKTNLTNYKRVKAALKK